MRREWNLVVRVMALLSLPVIVGGLWLVVDLPTLEFWPWWNCRMGAMTKNMEARIRLASHCLRTTDLDARKRAQVHFMRGNAFSFLGNYEAGKADYDETLRLDPDHADAYYNRGMIFARLGEKDRRLFDAAIRDFTGAIANKPTDAAAFNNRGLAHQAAGHLDTALDDFTEALRLDPSHFKALWNRGSARAVKGDWKGAAEDFAAFKAAKAEDPRGYFGLAVASMEHGEFAKALSEGQEALRRVSAFEARPAPLRELEWGMDGYEKAMGLAEVQRHEKWGPEIVEKARKLVMAAFVKAVQRMGPDDVAKVQKALKEKGTYKGEVDGKRSRALWSAAYRCLVASCGLELP